MTIMQGAEPYFLLGGNQGVLLIHGFTGSPSEMRLLGEYLNNQGYTVLAPRLCGHGTTVEEMAQTKWLHWYSAVEDGYHILKSVCKTITVIGLSMGGLLALKLSGEYPVTKLVSLSTPIELYDKRLPMLPLYRLFRQYAPKKQRKYKVESRYSVTYGATPLSSVDSLLNLIKHIQGQLYKIEIPILIIQSKREHTVKPQSAQYIYDHIASTHKQLIWLEKSGHIVILDDEREMVFEEIIRFIRSST